jgi:hypothetical protein
MTDVSSPKSGKNAAFDIHNLLILPLQYWKQSVLVIAVIVVSAGGYALFGTYQKSQAEKAETALSTLVATTSGADLLKALTAMAQTAPAGVRDAVNLELAKAALAAGDFAQAATAWAAVAKSAPASMRAVAALGQASALSQAGQHDKAVDVLEHLKADVPKAFAMTVDRQLAITAEDAGQWQKALDAYERMKADGNLQNPGFIDARIASLRAKLGPDGAAKTNG